jgi:predicted metal-dependent hydrolase
MPIITDSEFGQITVRRSARATQVRIRVAPDGRLRASLPLYAPLFLVKRLIKSSRPEIRAILSSAEPEFIYQNGMQIGKSHTLLINESHSGKFKVAIKKQRIIVDLPSNQTLNDADNRRALRSVVAKALRSEAKSYLPRRLEYLAGLHGYNYETVRFSHASSRWGSCSSNGTISLNIALMKLPFELIDYVLLHELAHTQEMNHSDDFWKLVAATDPEFKTHRLNLKKHLTAI